MKIVLLIIFTCLTGNICAQVTDSLNTTTEQQLENLTENNEDLETEDDSYLQEMVILLRNPINLNNADEASLKELRMLTPVQIQSLLNYREVLGNLLSIYELQAVPGWDIQAILKVRPYITVSSAVGMAASLGERFTQGDHSLLLRTSQVIENSRGFLLDSTQATNYYLGSRQRIMMRYRYTYKNLLQYGIVGEKDPGEQFFNGSQKSGFDFYSVHLFLRNLGIIKSLALGDYTVNLGQGLTQWQSLAFKKGPDVLGTKRQASVLRPYSSAGEINFHRGAGITIGKDKWEATVFGSVKNIDANFVADTSESEEEFVSSLQVSGYHRTKSEIADKDIQRQVAYGGNISYRINSVRIGVNAIRHHFKFPLRKDDQPYNRLALSGKSIGNYSADYSFTYKNMHLFGELATTDKNEKAFVNGLLISTAANVDLSFFYRNIAPGYQALNGNAFTESTFPTNERGFFAGISVKPTSQWQLDAYADMYKFPGLKFRVNGPSYGSDHLIQLQYRPNKQLDIYTRYKRESKGINFNPEELAISPIVYQPRQNWRTQLSYKITPEITIRNRAEILWFDRKSSIAEQGFLIFGDILYKPQLKRYSGNIRLQYFETDGYNSRLYAFENDVLYSFSIPVFYDKGYRYYLNVNYDITRKLTAWGRIAQTIYSDRSVIGSGLDEIEGNRRTEVKLQLIYKF